MRVVDFNAYNRTNNITRSHETSHGHLLLLFKVAYNVGPAVLADGNSPTVDPHADNISGTFIVTRLLGDCVQLLLEVLNAFSLLLNLQLVLAVNYVHELLCCVLVLHLRLPPPSLAARLQDVNATALGSCKQRYAIMLETRQC